MKISICITYYNQKDFVTQSIESVLNINFPCDYEILCGDDGSTDGTKDILKDYTKKYPDKIKYYEIARDKTGKSISRASHNRLNLVKKATGNYIMFLDGDDFYCDNTFVNKALQIFQNNKNVVVCAFNFKYLHTNNLETTHPQSMQEGEIKAKKYISKAWYTHVGSCIFKNILDNNKLDFLCKINNFDDNAITIYMLQFGSLYYIDEPIYIYRQTGDSLWNNATDCEKNIINALDYKLISNSAPKFKNEILVRNFCALKYLYWNKKLLADKLSDKYDKYIAIAKNNNDKFILNLLGWNTLKFCTKLRTIMIWQNYKISKRIGTWSK